MGNRFVEFRRCSFRGPVRTIVLVAYKMKLFWMDSSIFISKFKHATHKNKSSTPRHCGPAPLNNRLVHLSIFSITSPRKHHFLHHDVEHCSPQNQKKKQPKWYLRHQTLFITRMLNVVIGIILFSPQSLIHHHFYYSPIIINHIISSIENCEN